MWKIIGPHHDETTIDALLSQYPALVAYDESGFDVALDDFAETPQELANSGYTNSADRRILFWTCEEDSVQDDGMRAVAEARWEE